MARPRIKWKLQAENIELVLYSLDRMFKSITNVFDARYEYGLSHKAIEYGYSILIACCKDSLLKLSKITGRDVKIIISEFRSDLKELIRKHTKIAIEGEEKWHRPRRLKK